MQPPSSPSSHGSSGGGTEPLYEAFFGLREQPFSLTTDPRFLYLSASHRLAFDELLTGLRRHEGLLLLTGDTGTGKTTLCRAVIDSLGHRTFSALVLNPYMNDAEVLRTILRDFNLVTRDDIRSGAFDRADVPHLMDTLHAFLKSLVPLQSYAVVIIDEAQSLSPRVLDQIRVLGSLEHEGRRLLQIVLVGQPSLIETLRSDAMRALADRISRRVALGSLPARDVEAYIKHRLAIAGGNTGVTFEADAIARVADVSDGLPRRINLLCDRALEVGRAAGTTTINAAIISRAAKALSGAPLPPLEREAPAATAPAPSPVQKRTTVAELGPVSEPTKVASIDFDVDPATPRRPLGDEFFKDLDISLEQKSAPSHDRDLELIMEAAPKRSGRLLMIALIVLAGAGATSLYVAIRMGWIKL